MFRRDCGCEVDLETEVVFACDDHFDGNLPSIEFPSPPAPPAPKSQDLKENENEPSDE